MAQRFGGQFSPDGNRPIQSTIKAPPPSLPPLKVEGIKRTRVLFLSSFAFLFPAFRGTPDEMLMGLGAGALLILSAWLTREGAKAEAAFNARKVAKRPAFPRKIAGAVAAGLALGVGGMISQPVLLYPILFAIVGACLHLMSFGPDPLSDKGMEGIDQFQTDRVARAVDEGEKHLAAMKDAILRTKDRQIEARVDRFITAARALFRTVENDPGDLTAARKYLSVYLMGARDAAVKFADVYAQNRDAKARADFEALLTDLETTFASRTTALVSNSRTDLDVEIAVLRDRLKLEN